MATTHTHVIKDVDTRFIVDPVTRQMKNVGSTKTVLVQYDHNSERFTFELPRTIEEHDMSLCDKAEVHYINIDAKTKKENHGLFPMTDLRIAEDNPDKVICSWLISANATQLVGNLSFALRFVCNEGEEVEYSWNTAIHSSISVVAGIDNTEQIVADYTDVLEVWKNEIFAGFAEIPMKSVQYDEPQELTEEQKETARENIGFTEKLIETLDGLGVISVLKDADGKYILDGDGSILLLPKDKAETKAVILETLLELDIIPVIYDADGAILTDENGDILLSK